MESNPSAAARVFSIPELLDGILKAVYLDGPREFARLLRVSKTFYSVAAPYVWGSCGFQDHPRRLELAGMGSI